ncbi:unnamed protein product (mitochondrion) [Plasmodiophora brassicae]|uniref:JmjC domain-containing protein n=1 Tax=Plasmodiophora brassicae TaxID=37360 RepID=A0A0G4J275_PLABS|nr:hypothetical protein PBRA_008665 [Plasmodiophora brassicae]SPQ98531.1 unnamed protein product [Plasmodiophora brassicae]
MPTLAKVSARVTSQLAAAWVAMAQEARDLWVPRRVPAVDAFEVTPLEFHRRYVGPNTPALIRGGCRHWPAIRKWTNAFLVERMATSPVSVALTPDGRGDCLVDGRYVSPYEEQMSLERFFHVLTDPGSNAIPYIQKQCDSLHEEFGRLCDDVPELGIGRDLFTHLDAANVWIGDSRAYSAVHSDAYENLLCVVAGVKHVTLFPPTDLPFLYQRQYARGQYARDSSGEFRIEDCGENVVWVSVDPPDVSLDEFPLYEHASPIEVAVEAGDVLYLPSLWYHRVGQTPDAEGRCIAVNFWYDMQYDSRYTWMRFQESFAGAGR